ncbi:phosphotransferase [Leucobacter allii]|uniref:Phosphotransferase n=1 Tax=Leucobacter allii TaxID=2932247 RepID=A0ABY4FIB0_9MICO|nr:phosphotransferase [Leucobacter allii]UOQ55737.1 phosphotransferase [Leucobacter allii]
MEAAHVAHDRRLLAEALGVDEGSLALRSREPLGRGGVAGFDCASAGEAPLRYYVDTSRLPVVRETGLVLGDVGAPDARVWLHPADPHLPALAPVAFDSAAGALLTRFGIDGASAPEIAAYRPGRRAVLRVPGAQRNVWVKVLRPSRVQRVVAAHTACADGGVPVPELIGWSPDGVILMEEARGVPATAAEWEPAALLDAVDELRADLAGIPALGAAQGVIERLPWYASGLSEVSAAAPVIALAEAAVAEAKRVAGMRPVGVVHGDLHFGQLFLSADGAGILGVVDVDGLGAGDPAEDAGAFLAHAAVSAMLTPPARRPGVWELVRLGAARWGDDPMVRACFAVHMLGHAIAAHDRGASGIVRAVLAAARIALARVEGTARTGAEGAATAGRPA